MTVHTYRFRRTEPIDQDKLRGLVGVTATIVASDGGQVVDIDSDDATDDPEDLKEQLGFLGFNFEALDPTDSPSDAFTPKGGSGGGGSVSGIWKFSTSTTAADPGTGRFRFNNAAYASVTEIFVDDLADSPRFDFGNIFESLNPGDILIVQENDDSTSAVEFLIDDVTDNIGWWTFDVTYIQDAGGDLIGNNRASTLAFVFESDHLKHNFTATTDPGATDDSDSNYEVGSHWVNVTSDEAFINVDASVGAAQWPSLTSGGGAAIGFEEWTFADDLTVPVTADWAINVVSPLDEDALNSAIHALMFDDTTEEGGATHRTVPSGAVSMIFKTMAKPASAPGGAVAAAYHLRFREIADNAAVSAWSSPVQLTDIDFPASQVFHQKDETDNTLVTWGLTVGKTYQFLLSRDVGDAADDLSGDCGIMGVGTEWTT